jgi:hypothetical protein
VRRRDLPGVVGPILPPADFGFGYLGTVSHEFFKPLSITLDFTTMTTLISGLPVPFAVAVGQRCEALYRA